MSKRFAKKKFLLLCDHAEIARATRCLLEDQAEVVSLLVEPDQASEQFNVPENPNLIIMVLSEQRSEPIVVLARSALGHLLNRVPMLIVSEKSFQPHWQAQIACLEFPFTPDQLLKSVDDSLTGNISHRFSAACSSNDARVISTGPTK
ncbi:MAG: hypothetical protein HZB51_04120 [Chloroflexi bacterium]|nr:hypothetical protein [Chloroflexota bacterium]